MFYPLLLEGLPSTGFASLTGGYWKDVRDVRLHLEILLQGGKGGGGWVGGGVGGGYYIWVDEGVIISQDLVAGTYVLGCFGCFGVK